MRRTILSFCFLIFLSPRLLSQLPNLAGYLYQPAGTTVFTGGNTTSTEVPPWMIMPNSGLKQYFFVDGINSYVAGSAASNNFITSTTLTAGTPVMVTQALYSAVGSCPYALVLPSSLLLAQATAGINKATSVVSMNPGFSATPTSGPFYAEIVNGLATGQDWREDYYSVYTAQYFTDSVQGPTTLAFQHAENKMMCPGHPNSPDPTYCFSSVSPFKASYGQADCSGSYYPEYSGFVCASWIPNNTATQNGEQLFNDMGPIAWPSIGYLLPSGQKASKGLRHPSSIISGGYVYVYYLEDGPYTAPNDPAVPALEGRYGGIKLVRAPLSSARNPNSYQVYYKDPTGNVIWNPALPPGFDKNNIDAFWNIPGGKSTDVMGGVYTNPMTWETRFSVAKVRNTNYFIGIESYQDYTDPQPNGDGYLKKALRASLDLVNWGPRTVIERVTDWTLSQLNYPILMSSDGLSNNLVDSSDFYVLGTTGGNITHTTNKMHVYLPSSGSARPLSSKPLSAFADSADIGNAPPPASLAGIVPNPNNGIFQLNYTLTGSATIEINIFDITGRLILEGKPVTRKDGYYQSYINLSSRTRGIYLVELVVNGSKRVYKAVYE